MAPTTPQQMLPLSRGQSRVLQLGWPHSRCSILAPRECCQVSADCRSLCTPWVDRTLSHALIQSYSSMPSHRGIWGPPRKLSQRGWYTKAKVLIDYYTPRVKTLTVVYHPLLAIVLYDVSHAPTVCRLQRSSWATPTGFRDCRRNTPHPQQGDSHGKS
jgi:hypothetical protein